MAYPATIAITGFGVRRIWTCRSSTLSRPMPRRSLYPSSPRMRWSPPEQNALSPSPVRMMTPISASSRATLNACDSSNSVVGLNAFRTSGRLMVILAIPSAVSYRMSVYSCPSAGPDDFQSTTRRPPAVFLICPINLTTVTSRPLHAVQFPPAAGERMLTALAAALDGSGPAILPLDPALSEPALARILTAFAPAALHTMTGTRSLRLPAANPAAVAGVRQDRVHGIRADGGHTDGIRDDGIRDEGSHSDGIRDETAVVIATSGSTGEPKAAELS